MARNTTRIAGLVVLIGALALIWWLLQIQDPVERQFSNLPWQIETPDARHTRVLGFTLGKSTPAAFAGKLPVPDIRLFVEPSGELIVEAFYVNVRVEPFEANLVARLDWPEDQRDWLLEQRTSERAMPSGSRRYGLSDAALVRMGQRPIIELSYIPRARWSDELLRTHFGAPPQRLDPDPERSYWLYPDRALAVMVPRRGRVLMHYGTLEHWDDIVERLERLVENRLQES